MTGVPIIRYSQITPLIYVGPQHGRRGLHKLERIGITGLINLRSEFDDAAHGLAPVPYCHLPTANDAAPTTEHLVRGMSFIDKVVSEGGKVYIHCAGGVGRAPTMAAAYFIAHGWSLDEAINLIRGKRPFIVITPPQLNQLRLIEETLRGRERVEQLSGCSTPPYLPAK